MSESGDVFTIIGCFAMYSKTLKWLPWQKLLLLPAGNIHNIVPNPQELSLFKITLFSPFK